MSPVGSMKPPPPEEKLLRLIRAKGGKPSVAAPAARAEAPAGSAGGAAVVLGARGRPWVWSRLAIGALSTMLAVEVVVLLMQALRPLPTVRVPDVSAQPAEGPSASAPELSEMPSLAGSVSRPLFSAPAAEPSGARPSSAPSGTAQQLASRLTLLGIVAGEPPQAIIEDAQTKKTHFVTTGQAVADGAVVSQVLENRVILDFQGETIELTL